MVYFYPHSYLRDRQLDTIRNWPSGDVLNPEIAQNRKGAQVSKEAANGNKVLGAWKQRLPLLNIKLRPKAAPIGCTVYVWGGLIATGPFILDIDNPWSLVGYNVRAMPLYRFAIKKILLSSRCKGIRCMSEACRMSLKHLFGEQLYRKAEVRYPSMKPGVHGPTDPKEGRSCRFLFVGTQFELKGGGAFLQACRIVSISCPGASFRIITHLPEKYRELADAIPNCTVLPANLNREMVAEQMKQADVLVHPSFMESFGMVLLEAISCGLGVITTDMYASSEIVVDGENGFVIKPPISSWDGYLPTRNFLVPQLIKNLKSVDYDPFTQELAKAMVAVAADSDLRFSMKRKSTEHFNRRFAR